MDLSGLVPSTGEMPFFSFTTELISYYRPISADLAEAMEARFNWRDASEKTKPESLRQIADGAAMLEAHDRETARMMAARPQANLRAAGILVTLQAIMEDVRQSVVGNTSDQFGPPINTVAACGGCLAAARVFLAHRCPTEAIDRHWLAQ